MDFLDQLIDPLLSNQSDLTEVTARRLNYMIAVALIHWEERHSLEMKVHTMTEKEALALCDKLKDSMPQVGYHTIPHSVAEQGQAIRYAVDKDDYYEQRTNIQSKGERDP